MKFRMPRFTLFPRTRREWRGALLRLAIVLSILIGGGFVAARMMRSMPGTTWSGPLPAMTDAQRELSARLRGHVTHLAGEIGERNLGRLRALEAAATSIERDFSATGLTTSTQHFDCYTIDVRNIMAERRGASLPDEIVVVGAHYDSVEGCPAANDNGSGIAATLELARHFAAAPAPARTIRFVAFVNEEPPYFQGEKMGSLVYARACRARGDQVVAMLSLETMGCFSDAPGSQLYPYPFKLAYPTTGNFIGFVSDFGSRALLRRAVGAFRNAARFPSEGAAAPRWIQGVGWSDHWSFWQAGYPAIMVTDTAPFRYPYYHTPQDTPEKLDYDRLARVVEGLAGVVADLAGSPLPAR